MYTERPWLMGSYSGFGSAEDTNQRYKELLASGTTSLNVALDLPTQQGLDSDDPISEGEVGRVGVAIDTLSDIELLFDGIDLNEVTNLSCIANAISPIMLAMFIALAEKRGNPRGELAIYLQNDSLKELTARGNFIFPAGPSLKLSIDVADYCRSNLPKSPTISFCGYHFREAGADAAQEIALALVNARAYMQEAIRRGMTADDIGPTLSMFLAAGMELFEEIAKFRAARRIWAQMMRDEFHSIVPASQAINIRCYTSGSHLTAQNPHYNIVRTTVEAMAGVLGGIQAMVVSSMDEALSIPTKEAQRIALATQQILYHETGIGKTADPLGGSYFIERLTDEFEKKIIQDMTDLEKHGGAIGAIENGYIQSLLSESAYRHQLALEKGERVLVGVNRFRENENDTETYDIFTSNPETEKRQVMRLRDLRRKRDSQTVKRCLQSVQKTAQNGGNVIPSIIDAVKLYATVGEIIYSLKAVYGTANDIGSF
jgi:methylmalonyl-CoA mutase N-terminal domain/subunit